MSWKDNVWSSKVVSAFLSKKVLIGCSVGLSSAAALVGITRMLSQEKIDEKLFLSNRLNTYEIYSSTKPNPKLTDLEHVEAFLEQSRPQFQDQIDQTLSSIRRNFSPQIAQNPIGTGLYTGSLGMAYTMFHLSSCWGTESEKKEFLANSLKYLESYAKVLPLETSKMYNSLYLGSASYYAIAAVIYDKNGQQQKSQENIKLFLDCANKLQQCDNLLQGNAGFLQACMFLNKNIPSCVPENVIKTVMRSILDRGAQYAKDVKTSAPLMWPSPSNKSTWMSSFFDKSVPQTGMSLGTPGILYSLLQFSQYLTEDDKKQIKETIQFFLTLRLRNGNFPLNIDGTDDTDYIQFSRGPSGFMFLLVKAWEVFGETKYIEEAKFCAKTVWQRGLVTNGNSLNSGIAGNGYAFLSLYRATKDPKYLFNALQFAKFTWSTQAKTEQKVSAFPYSLFEGRNISEEK